MCGCGSVAAGANVAQEGFVADNSGQPSDDQVYVVAYFNNVTEEVVGLDAARARLINPASRIPEGQDAPQGGTYSMKRE
jgi:hypothetical protein